MRVIPAPFQSPRVLRVLNVAAVGLSLAAVVSAGFSAIVHEVYPGSLSTGVPTLILGTFWAGLLRWRKTVGNSTFRWGWAASVPLAILNASVAAGLVMVLDGGHARWEQFWFGALLGATFGAIIWIPALFGTLVCFGAPIAHGQRLAAKGLAGEERGEWIIGLVCVAMSLLGLALSSSLAIPSWIRHADAAAASLLGVRVLAVLGALAGGTATVLARAREARRRRFVTQVEAGAVAGYRIDPTGEGKVLVRVVSQGEGYRVADFEEEVFELDAAGEATRPRHLAGASQG